MISRATDRIASLRQRTIVGTAFIREPRNGGEVLYVVGDIDISNAAELQSALTMASLDGGPIILDLEECTYLDMAGLSVIVRERKRLRNRLRVHVVSDSFIRRIFDLAGASALLSAH